MRYAQELSPPHTHNPPTNLLVPYALKQTNKLYITFMSYDPLIEKAQCKLCFPLQKKKRKFSTAT